MPQFNQIRERFLANARQYLLASDTTKERRHCTRGNGHPAICTIKPQARFMDTAA